MIVLGIIITLLYTLLIGSLSIGISIIKPFTLNGTTPKTKFSIIIPFRNEAEHLPHLLHSIFKLKYPKALFEVILVDDDSKDGSTEIIKNSINNANGDLTLTSIRVIPNERHTNAPKKDAITTGIKAAKHEWIITTDADCTPPKYWLDSFDAFIQHTTSVCIAAPVTYHNNPAFLSRFQLLDILSLQGATMGGFGLNRPFLCNGANFAYTKKVFYDVKGFEGNTAIASGDDIFLLEKIIKKHPKTVHYLKCKNAIVHTHPQPTWKTLILQRMRWAAKTSNYNNSLGKLTGILVFLMNALILTLPIIAIVGWVHIKIWLCALSIKLLLDVLILYKTSVFFNQQKALQSFLTSFFIYPFFSVYVAVLSLFKDYQWKGRTFKR
ncbi:glycosyltransferase [Flavobacteriaceae bacterium MHTCC 0001]